MADNCKLCEWSLPDAEEGPCISMAATDDAESCPDFWPIGKEKDSLEQVALDMYNAMAPLHEPCCEDTCRSLRDDGWPDDFCLYEFRDRLKALGVSVDA